MFNLRKNRKGFTLIELIIVIAIIAILAAIAIPSFIGITNQANQKTDIANATNIAMAVNSWNALNPTDQITSSSTLTYTALSTKLGAAEYDLWPKGLAEANFTSAMIYIEWDGNAMIVDQTNTPS